MIYRQYNCIFLPDNDTGLYIGHVIMHIRNLPVSLAFNGKNLDELRQNFEAIVDFVLEDPKN